MIEDYFIVMTALKFNRSMIERELDRLGEEYPWVTELPIALRSHLAWINAEIARRCVWRSGNPAPLNKWVPAIITIDTGRLISVNTDTGSFY